MVFGEKISLRPVLKLSLFILGMSKRINNRHRMSRLSLTYQRISLSPDFFLKVNIFLIKVYDLFLWFASFDQKLNLWKQ